MRGNPKKRLMTMKNDQLVLKQEIKGKEQKEESLSLGVTMTIGEYAIVDKLANFLLKYPEMNLHIHYGNTTQLLTLLDQGIINMALVEGIIRKRIMSIEDIARKIILQSVRLIINSRQGYQIR